MWLTADHCGPSLAIHALLPCCGPQLWTLTQSCPRGAHCSGQAIPGAWRRCVAGVPRSPPAFAAATSTPLNSFPPAPTSSCLSSHISWAVATWSPFMSHLPFAAAGFISFPGSSALVSAVPCWEDEVSPGVISTAPQQCRLFTAHTLLFPHQLYPISLEESDSPVPGQQHLPRVNPRAWLI